MTRRLVFLCLFGATILASLASPVWAYIRLQRCGTTVAWASGSWPLSYVIASKDTAGATVSNASKLGLRYAFERWDGLAGTEIDLNENTNAAAQARTDWEATDIHLVLFDPDNSSGFFSGSVVAVTVLSYFVDGSNCPTTGEIVDADLLINSGSFNFSVSAVGVGGQVDLANVVTHEVGHFVGLDHVPNPSATMTALTSFAETRKRSLSQDDISGAAEIRPMSAGGYGTVTGTIHRPGGGAAAYPYVSAIDSDGNVIAGALGNSSGVFSFACPAGTGIGVYATPYPGTMGSEISQAGTPSSDFSMSFYGDNDTPDSNTVSDGATLSLGTLTSNAVIVDGASTVFFEYPVNADQISRGSSNSVTIDKEDSSGALTGLTLELSNPSSADLTVTGGGTPGMNSVTFTATAASGASKGDRDVRLMNGDMPAKKIVSIGAIEIVDPAPTISSVLPVLGSGNGGDAVTIVGTGFTGSTSTQKVLFGDAFGTVTDVTSTSITVNTPAHDAGTVNVGVINPDGRGAVSSNAFTFGVSLASVSPASVCYTSLVTITLNGTGFEAGMTVTVNGVDCTNITISSATSLTAKLPLLDPGTYSIVVTKADTSTASLVNGIVFSTSCGGGGGGGCFGSMTPSALPPVDHTGLFLPLLAFLLCRWILSRRRLS